MEAKATLDVIFTNSPEQTKKLAQDLAKILKPKDVIALYGELGTGKTVFVQGIAKGLNIKRKITSPTFVFIKLYPLKTKDLTFYHLDLYRVKNSQDLATLGIEEVFSQNSICAVEWADKIKDKLPQKRIDIKIEKINERNRRITIKRDR